MKTRTAIRKALTATLCLALLQSGLLLAAVDEASAQPFACDPGFYQVINGQLNEFDPATDLYTPLGPQQGRYNAMAHRPEDGYLVVENVLDDSTLNPVCAEYHAR